MKLTYLVAIAATAFGTAASAQVYNTSLQNENGVAGTSTYATTTDATGTRTVVTGPGPNADVNRAHGMPVIESWYQNNVGAGSTVGITTDYARSGNGSAYFNSTQGDTGKGDLQYYYGGPISLSALTSASFDFYRDSASTTNSTLAPVLRFDMLRDGVFAGALIFENAYQSGGPPAAVPTDAWSTLTATLNSGNWWTNNALLGPTNATAGGTKTLAQWIADNAGHTLSVYGLEIGIGSGWNGTFYGGVDNVNVNFGSAGAVNSNFEVAPVGGVPEPATWAMMLLGFGFIGGAIRSTKRRQKVALWYA